MLIALEFQIRQASVMVIVVCTILNRCPEVAGVREEPGGLIWAVSTTSGLLFEEEAMNRPIMIRMEFEVKPGDSLGFLRGFPKPMRDAIKEILPPGFAVTRKSRNRKAKVSHLGGKVVSFAAAKSRLAMRGKVI